MIEPLACSLAGQEQEVTFVPGTKIAAAYARSSSVERFYCNYGLNPAYEGLLAECGLRITARGPEAEARAVELDDHPFFLGTLFLPQMGSRPGAPDPVVAAFAAAVSGP